jgi:hypothetical protein
MSSSGILFSDNEDYNKLLTDEQLLIQDPQTREFTEIKFKKIDSSHHKYLQPSNSYYNFDKDTLNHTPNPNYNTNTPEENHMAEQAFSLQEEINLSSMISILDITKFNYAKYTISAPSVIANFIMSSKISANIPAHHLLFQINKRLLELGYSSDKHSFSFFKIDTLQELPSKKSNQLIAMMRISRTNKIYNFTIEFSINYSLNKNSLIVKYDYITLKGINSDYEFDKYKKDTISQKHSIINHSFNSDLDYEKEFNKVNRIIRENKKAYTKDPMYHSKLYENIMLYPDNGCFIKNKTNSITKLETENPIRCKSYWSEYGYNGVWDSKCKSNKECPFYSAKQSRGGCDTKSGICEMPLGIVRIGFKKYLKDSKAKCKKCPIRNPYCCYSKANPQYKFI